MANNNPYAPPQAVVRDMDADNESFQAVSAFTYKGRIGRLRYFAYSVTAYFAVILAAALLGALSVPLHLPIWFASIVPIIPYGVVIVMLSIQRSHDMDWSGWMIFLALIPFVGLIWLFKGGTKGANRFGAPTPPNSTGVKVIAWIFPAIFIIIGVVAAIALPAYQGYTQRAKAKRAAQSAPAAVPAPATEPAPVSAPAPNP
jgi:uncharacterized membrane protein YhaH (DUF805 family)